MTGAEARVDREARQDRTHHSSNGVPDGRASVPGWLASTRGEEQDDRERQRCAADHAGIAASSLRREKSARRNDTRATRTRHKFGRLSARVGTALAGPPDATAVRVTALHLPRGLFDRSLPTDLRSRMDLAKEIGEEALHHAAS